MGNFKNPIRCSKCHKVIGDHTKAYVINDVRLDGVRLDECAAIFIKSPVFLCSECEKQRIEALVKAQNDWLGVDDSLTCKYYDDDRKVRTGQKRAPRCSCNGDKALCEKQKGNKSMNITQEQAQALYEYWFINSDSLCECCSDYVECKGKECPQYKVTGTFMNYFGEEVDETCVDLDFADYDYLKNTRCYKCTHEGLDIETFNWNGKVK